MTNTNEATGDKSSEPTTSASTDDANGVAQLRERVIAALRTVFDPEIPVNVYELGLIYDLDIAAGGKVAVRMTLTAPNCPMADMILQQVEAKVKSVDGVTATGVELVWDPPWSPARMSDAAKLQLNLDMDATDLPHREQRYGIGRL